MIIGKNGDGHSPSTNKQKIHEPVNYSYMLNGSDRTDIHANWVIC